MPSRILVDLTHPAHVHFFRPAMEIWQQRGYQLIVVARDKDVTLPLLDHYGYRYTVLSKARRGLAGLGRELMEHEGRLLGLIRRERPDVILEIAGTFVVHAAALTRTPALVFYDTEHARLSNRISYPFATRVFTPDCYQGDIGRRHVRYAGYHELAYLHPDYFQPDRTVLADLGLNPEEAFSVVRFVSWEASHDHGIQRIPLSFKRRLVERLSTFGRLFITSESPLPAEFEPFRINLAPHRIHHLLAFAQLYVGEGATMASEAAVLGTPAIYLNALPLGYLEEQQQRYGLVHSFRDVTGVIDCADQLLARPDLRAEWQQRRRKMLAEKIDVTQFICDQVEPYLTGDLDRRVTRTDLAPISDQ